MNDPLARLRVQQGPLPGQEFTLSQERVVIGRASSNDIVISDAEVSRQHAEVVRQEMGYAIRDLGSTNGTFVNGERVVTLTPLHPDDLIELGEMIHLIFLTSASAPSPAAADALPAAADTIGVAPQPSPTPPVPADAPSWEADVAPPEAKPSRRRWILGCGCGCLLVVFLCMATLFFLDGYDQGRLLYCGPLQPIFETLLGPVGFSPACALP